MKLYLVVQSPSAGFSQRWNGARGLATIQVLNVTVYFVSVTDDQGALLYIVPPFTRAEISLGEERPGWVTVADAGLGAATAPTGVTGNAVYLGGDRSKGQTQQQSFAVASWT
jgi:hypothetical protein